MILDEKLSLLISLPRTRDSLLGNGRAIPMFMDVTNQSSIPLFACKNKTHFQPRRLALPASENFFFTPVAGDLVVPNPPRRPPFAGISCENRQLSPFLHVPLAKNLQAPLRDLRRFSLMSSAENKRERERNGMRRCHCEKILRDVDE